MAWRIDYIAVRICYIAGRIGYIAGRIGYIAGRIGYIAGRIGYIAGRIGYIAVRIVWPGELAIAGIELAISCNPSYREESSWDAVVRMASFTLQKLQIWVRTKAIFKLEVKGKELDAC